MQILLSSNKEIIKEYIKPNSKIGFIPTASELENDRWYMEKDRNDLISMDFNLINIDITKESKESILEKLKDIDALFVAGGNSFYLLQQIKKKNILIDLINFAKNKIYIGSSAGSCIACPSIEYLENLDNKSEAPDLKDFTAMNLIDAYILPHYKCKEKYTKMIDAIVEKYNNLNFILLTNEQAVVAESKNNYRTVNTK